MGEQVFNLTNTGVVPGRRIMILNDADKSRETFMAVKRDGKPWHIEAIELGHVRLDDQENVATLRCSHWSVDVIGPDSDGVDLYVVCSGAASRLTTIERRGVTLLLPAVFRPCAIERKGMSAEGIVTVSFGASAYKMVGRTLRLQFLLARHGRMIASSDIVSVQVGRDRSIRAEDVTRDFGNCIVVDGDGVDEEVKRWEAVVER